MPRSWFSKFTRPTTLLTVSRTVQISEPRTLARAGRDIRPPSCCGHRNGGTGRCAYALRPEGQDDQATLAGFVGAELPAQSVPRGLVGQRTPRSDRCLYLMPWIPRGKSGSI